MEKPQHSPLPWRVTWDTSLQDKYVRHIIIRNATHIIAKLPIPVSEIASGGIARVKADADLIVEAVNRLAEQ